MATEVKDGYLLCHQEDGPDLGYSGVSSVKIIEKDGRLFKSFDGSDNLKP